MKCQRCGTDCADSQKFCGQCGNRLGVFCASCGKENPQASNFCPHCGESLKESAVFGIDENSLVTAATGPALQMLAMEKDSVIGKPFVLFLADGDLAVFFTHRNKVLTTGDENAFELRLKRPHADSDLCVECTLTRDDRNEKRSLLLKTVDVSDHRRELDSLHKRSEVEKIITSLSGELIRCATREIDLAINRALKTVGVATQIEHCYVCEYVDHSIRVTYEWFANRSATPVVRFKRLPVRHFDDLLSPIRSGKPVFESETEPLPESVRSDLEQFVVPDTRSLACFPLQFGQTNLGFIGFDSQKPRPHWSQDLIRLYRGVGEIVLNGIIRRRDEDSWRLKRKEAIANADSRPVRKNRLKEVDRKTAHGSSSAGYAATAEPLEIRPESFAEEEESKQSDPQWTFRFEDPPDGSKAIKVYERGSNILITCPNCMQRKELPVSEMTENYRTIRVTCPCRYRFYIVLELRSSFRKPVDLEGYFIRAKADNRVADSSSSWGSIYIKNISRNGLGFVAPDHHDIRGGDRLVVRFNLDNSAKTAINKHVDVKSVQENYVACQFAESDQYDVTLGFYLM